MNLTSVNDKESETRTRPEQVWEYAAILTRFDYREYRRARVSCITVQLLAARMRPRFLSGYEKGRRQCKNAGVIKL
jgi:hypothetical protein